MKKSKVLIFTVVFISLICLTGCSKNKESDTYIEAYIYNNTEEKDIQDVKEKIESMDKVVSVQYISKEDAYDRAVEKLGADAMKFAGYTKQTHPFPRMFIVKIKQNAKSEKIVEEIKKHDIFEKVTTNSKAADEIYKSVF